MTLASLLRDTPLDQQDAILLKHASSASDAELVALVVRPDVPQGPFIPQRLEDLIVMRGPAAVGTIRAAMLDHPTERSARQLAAMLVEIHERHPSADVRAAEIIERTVVKALDLGAGTWEVGELLGWYLEAGGDGRPGPEATRVGRRVLDLGAAEAEPYLRALERARALLGTVPPGSGLPPEAPQR